jgi:hypothetical protein
MKCPRCGYTEEVGGKTPMWVLELRSIARAQTPIFGGLLERGVWREDKTIVRFVDEGWIVPKGVEGFVATAKGRRAYAEFARQYKLTPAT